MMMALFSLPCNLHKILNLKLCLFSYFNFFPVLCYPVLKVAHRKMHAMLSPVTVVTEIKLFIVHCSNTLDKLDIMKLDADFTILYINHFIGIIY